MGTDWVFASLQPSSVQSYKKSHYSVQRYHDNISKSDVMFWELKKRKLWESPTIWTNNTLEGECVSMNLKMSRHELQKSNGLWCNSLFSIWQTNLAFTKQSSLALEYMIAGSRSAFDWQRLLNSILSILSHARKDQAHFRKPLVGKMLWHLIINF